jgi:hypothetical protein
VNDDLASHANVPRLGQLLLSPGRMKTVMNLGTGRAGLRAALGIGVCVLTGYASVFGSLAYAAHDAGPRAPSAGQDRPCTPLAGTRWTGRGEKEWWSSVASSADGSKLVAVGANIYTSTDAGTSWTLRGAWPFARQEWRSVASSADGSRLVAVAPCGRGRALDGCGYIYTSADAGATWLRRGPGPLDWYGVASSSDGQRLVAVIGTPLGETRGRIYISADAGQTWRATGPSRSFGGVTSSADGTKLMAAVSYPGGPLYASTNSGRTWRPSGPWLPWTSVASSADGSKLVASAYSDFLYTSADAGKHWRRRGSSDHWTAVASSADGTTMIAVVAGDRMFGNLGHLLTSRNSGATWVEQPFEPAGKQQWSSLASSADGTRLVAADFNGPIYVSSAPATPNRASTEEPVLPTCDEPAPLPPPLQAPPVGQEPEQRCPSSLLNAVGKQLDIRPLRKREPAVVTSACASDPDNAARTLVVAAYWCDASSACLGTTGLVVALVEREPMRVAASHQDTISARPEETGGFRILPTAYHLAEGVTAFAIDDRREFPARYVGHRVTEAWGAAYRTLYALEADRLRPVLVRLPMNHWRLLPDSGDSVESSVVETVDFRLLVQDTATRGYRDLSVTGTATRDDGQPSRGKPFRFRLRYDGRAYSSGSMFESFRRWIGARGGRDQ